MKTRLQALDRLRALYGVVTHMHGVALEQASAAVRDAEERIGEQKKRMMRSSAQGMAALDADDKLEWMMQESQRDFSERDAEWLTTVREKRELAMQTASELYRTNRLQLEQMQSVLKRLRSIMQRETAHREQRDSDDRFLSRQRWRERRGEDL